MRKNSVSTVVTAPLSLKSNLSWMFVGYAVYVLCQWGMLMVLAKLLSPTEVGRFALGLAVAAPVVLFTNLGLRHLQATDAKQEYAFADYLGLRLLTIVSALLAIVGITLLAGYPSQTTLVVMAVGLAKCFEAVSDIFYGLLQQREQMNRIAKSIIARGLLSLMLLFVMVYLTGSVLWGAMGMAAAWVLILVGYDLRGGLKILGQMPRPRWEPGTLRRLALVSLPLGVSALLVSLNANIPRYLVEHYLGERELGIFAAMTYPIVAGSTVVGALGQSASPRLSRYYSDDDFRAFRSLLVKLAGIGAVLGVVGLVVAAVAGRKILTLIYTPEYAEYLSVFLLLAAGAGIIYMVSFLGHGLIAARYLRSQIPLLAGTVSVTLGASILLIPWIGLLGAAAALILGIIFQLVGSAGILAHAIHKGGKR
jgi:O-antigen/teichoic acid export membrane protein